MTKSKVLDSLNRYVCYWPKADIQNYIHISHYIKHSSASKIIQSLIIWCESGYEEQK